MLKESDFLGYDDQGSYGSPGSQYHEAAAGVRKTKRGFELLLSNEYGSNQGYYQSNSRSSRRFRADTLDDVMRIALSAIKGDETFDDPKYAQAIRNAVFNAQDALDSEEADTKEADDELEVKRLEDMSKRRTAIYKLHESTPGSRLVIVKLSRAAYIGPLRAALFSGAKNMTSSQAVRKIEAAIDKLIDVQEAGLGSDKLARIIESLNHLRVDLESQQ